MFIYYHYYSLLLIFFFFFFNDTATTEIYTLSLHDALPIWWRIMAPSRSALLRDWFSCRWRRRFRRGGRSDHALSGDRKSTRLNSSHLVISYAVFCLKKKKILYKGIQDHSPRHAHCTQLS